MRFYIRNIPNPPPLPIIGNVLDFVGSTEHLWNHFRKLGHDYYPIYKVIGTFDDMVNIRHPDDAEVLLSSPKNITKSVIYEFLHDWFGTGLLTSTGHKWIHRRRVLTPAFHFNVLREFADTLDEEGRRMVHDLQLEDGAVTVDLVSFVTKYTLNAICETAMGTSLSNMENSSDNFLKRLLRPWLHPRLTFSLSPSGRILRKCLKIVRGFSKKIIKERQKYHDDTNGIHLEYFNENNEDSEVIYLRSSKKKLAMLDLLIAAKKN
ncbi:hypothetical protein PV325_008227, partial [Microctonus aethiopoides]